MGRFESAVEGGYARIRPSAKRAMECSPPEARNETGRNRYPLAGWVNVPARLFDRTLIFTAISERPGEVILLSFGVSGKLLLSPITAAPARASVLAGGLRGSRTIPREICETSIAGRRWSPPG